MTEAWTELRRVVRALVRRYSVEPSATTDTIALFEEAWEFDRKTMLLQLRIRRPSGAEAADLLL